MKKITRKNLEELLNEDWGKSGSDEREVTLILLCSAFVGAYPKKIKSILGCSEKILKNVETFARINRIWRNDRKVDCEWMDKINGGVALACDTAVCLGFLKRVKLSTRRKK
jgi:hypothetical protein